MRHTRHFFTLAALCVFVGVMAGPARAEGPATPPPTPPENLKGVYGAIGGGIGHDEDIGWAWRLMTWYRPFNYIAAEIGYADVEDGASGGDFDGLHLAVVPTIPVRPAHMDVLIKLGGFFNEDNHFAAGLGLQFHIYKNLGLRLDWDRLNWDESDGVDIVTLAAVYHLARQGK